ncbi:MAG: hypothetical protein EP297_13255, partial [Gammaproteobacteria bacterium]
RLPKQIEELEEVIEQLHASMSQADFYQQSGEVIAQAKEQVGELEKELEACYQRWEKLEAVG